MKILTALILWSLIALSCWAEDMSIVRLDQSVKLDGRGDDPAWRQSTVLENALTRLGTDGLRPQAETTVKLFHNGKSLFLLFECDEPDAGRIKATRTQRDDGIYLDDCVEVFLSSQNNAEPYYHFMVNPLGTQYDAKVSRDRVEAGWNGSWKAAATRRAGGYTVEMELPFAMFERPNSTTWRLLLARENKVRNELSSFPGLREKTFHMPSRFANVNGLEPEAGCFPFTPDSCRFRFDANRDGIIQGTFTVAFRSARALDRGKLLLKLDCRNGGKSILRFGSGELPAGPVKLDAGASLFDAGDYKADLYYADTLIGSWTCPVSMAEFNAEMLCPRYRNYIFDSMKLKELKVEVSPAVPGAAGKSGTVTLLDGGGRALGAPVAFTLGDKPQAVAVPLETPLTDGKYALEVELGGLKQQLPLEKVTVPAGMPEIWFDESNNLVADGKKVFPFGFFYAAPEKEGFTAAGFNVLADVFMPYVNSYDDCANALLFATARSFPESTYNSREVPQREIDRFRRKNEMALPRVAGWFVADEPGLQVKDAALYRRSLRMMKEISPYRPLFGCHNTVGALLELDIDLMDVISLDCYLGFERGKGHPMIPYSRLCTYFDTASKASKMRKPLWSVVESFSVGNYHRQPKTGRFPTISEHRMLVYLSIINGARGIVFWRDTQLSTPGVWKSLKAFAEEIRAMEPFLLAPDDHAKTVDGDVYTLRRDADGASCFIVANSGGEPRRVTLETGFSGTMHFLAENRTVESRNGKAELELAPYALHILWTKPTPALAMERILREYRESDSYIGRPQPGNVASFWRGAEPFASGNNRWTFPWAGSDENFTEVWACGERDEHPFYGVKLPKPEQVRRLVAVAAECPESVELTAAGGTVTTLKPAEAALSRLWYDEQKDEYVTAPEKPATANHVHSCWTWQVDLPDVVSIKVFARTVTELMAFHQ